MYNKGDDWWRHQPKLIAEGTILQLARRIKEHCQSAGKRDASIIFHGGEPLLGGIGHLRMVMDALDSILAGQGITITYGMQSNGLLLDLEMAEFLHSRNVRVGVSIDGPPLVHDKSRIDRRGRPTSGRLERRLRDLLASPYAGIFSGFLTVVDLDANPVEIIDYLSTFDPPKIDFLLPYDNYDRPPKGKETDIDSTVYGDWLVAAFEYWFNELPSLRIREFDSLLRQFAGGSPLVESIGLGVVDIVVIETNGEIEAVDSLKASFNGATRLGYNVFDDPFDRVAADIAITSRQSGATALCRKCQECELVAYCGGGYIPNRYASQTGFSNPTIYCSDMMKLLPVMRSAMLSEIRRGLSVGCAV